MKVNCSKIKSFYNSNISIAIANSCEAILLPIDSGCEPYVLDSICNEDEIYDIAYDFGWDKFIFLDLLANKEELIDLYELEIA